jgi:hypothetical protein
MCDQDSATKYTTYFDAGLKLSKTIEDIKIGNYKANCCLYCGKFNSRITHYSKCHNNEVDESCHFQKDWQRENSCGQN